MERVFVIGANYVTSIFSMGRDLEIGANCCVSIYFMVRVLEISANCCVSIFFMGRDLEIGASDCGACSFYRFVVYNERVTYCHVPESVSAFCFTLGQLAPPHSWLYTLLCWAWWMWHLCDMSINFSLASVQGDPLCYEVIYYSLAYVEGKL